MKTNSTKRKTHPYSTNLITQVNLKSPFHIINFLRYLSYDAFTIAFLSSLVSADQLNELPTNTKWWRDTSAEDIRLTSEPETILVENYALIGILYVLSKHETSLIYLSLDISCK